MHFVLTIRRYTIIRKLCVLSALCVSGLAAANLNKPNQGNTLHHNKPAISANADTAQSIFCRATQALQDELPTANLFPETSADKAADPAEGLFGLPIHIEARRMVFDPNKQLELTGDVHLRFGQNQGSGQALIHDFKTKKTVLHGPVTFKQKDLMVAGDIATLNLHEETAAIQSASYALRKNADTIFQGGAKSVLYRDSTLIARRAWLTSCAAEQNIWSISANYIRLSKEKLWGTARHAVFRIGKMPVLYLPWFRFPVSDARQSGFLIPDIGYQSTGGIDISLPYYLNLAPTYDATITPRWLSNRGLLTSVQFRHLSRYARNEWQAAYMHKDRLFNGNQSRQEQAPDARKNFEGAERWRLHWRHQGTFKDVFYTEVQYTKVSDNQYFQDFSNNSVDGNRIDLEQRAGLGYRYAGWLAELKAQRFQRLDAVEDQQPYDQLPALTLAWKSPTQRRFRWQIASLTAHFDATDTPENKPAITGRRASIEPRMSYNFKPVYGDLRLDLAWRYNHYNLETGLADSEKYEKSAASWLVSLTRKLVFERQTEHFGKKYLQTLEPTLYYLWSERDDEQEGLPLFDSARQTFSFEHLFRESRFSGHDRLTDANQLSLGVTSRWLSLASGRQWAQLQLGGTIRFENQKVGLTSQPNARDDNSLSPLVVQLELSPGKGMQLDIDWTYAPSTEQTDELAVRLQLKKSEQKIFNISYQRRGEVKQAKVSTYWPLSAKLHFAAAWRYDLLANKDLEFLVGLGYAGCCWRMRLAWQSFLVNAGGGRTETDEGVFLQLAPKGFGSIRSASNNSYSNVIDGFRDAE